MCARHGQTVTQATSVKLPWYAALMESPTSASASSTPQPAHSRILTALQLGTLGSAEQVSSRGN